MAARTVRWAAAAAAALMVAGLCGIALYAPLQRGPAAPERAQGEAPKAQPAEPAAAVPASAQSPRPAPVESLPPDCLAAGVFSGADTFCDRLGALLAGLVETADAEYLRRSLGARVRNRDLAGIDLSAPGQFFYMNPRKHKAPWVYRFEVNDEQALRAALDAAAAGPDGREPSAGFLRVDGSVATWSAEPASALAVAEWKAAGGVLPPFRAPGAIRFRLDVRGVLTTFDKELAEQVVMMKARMREALERGRPRPDLEGEIASLQADLDTALSLLSQVQDMDVGIDLGSDAAFLSADARVAGGGALARFIATHPKGTLRLLAVCPDDAVAVLAHNISIMGAVQRMLMGAIGLRQGSLFGRGAPPAGQTVAALFLSQQADALVDVVELRDRQTAADVNSRWDRIAGAGTDPAQRAFIVKPTAVEEPGEAGRLRLGEIVLNETLLGPRGTGALRRILGPDARLAQALRGDTSILVAGASPLNRLRQVEDLAAKPEGSLAADPSFRRTISSVRSPAGSAAEPNLLAYVSPEGVRRWLALAGLRPAPAESGQMGLMAALALVGPARINASLVLPTKALSDALRPTGPVPR